MIKLSNKTNIFLIFSYSLIALLFFALNLQRIGAFGCSDDCNNIMGGYFLLKGKHIYSEFFFNHAPLMAYISFLVQKISHPTTIYQLILFHRLSLFVFAFAFSVLLLIRFKWIALAFLLVFESVKYSFFGDRFLAESFVVYPAVYLLGLVLFKIKNEKLKPFDYIFSSIFVWFIIFMREPYIPLALFLYLCLVIGKKDIREKITSIGIFLILIIFTFY